MSRISSSVKRMGLRNMVEAAALAIAELGVTATRPDEELDLRLARALDYIRANIRNPLSLTEVAAAVALSESRYRQLVPGVPPVAAHQSGHRGGHVRRLVDRGRA